MKISIVIPCKDEAEVIGRLLDSVAKQTVKPHEVVVVDSNCTDNTMEIVATYANKLPLVTTKSTEKGISPARNTGGQTASGTHIIFVDADSVLPPEFLSKTIAEVRRRKLDAGGFTQRMPSRDKGVEFGARLMNVYARIMQFTPWPIAFGVIFSSRDVFKLLGGFDGELYIMEDYDYVYRAKKLGFKVGTIASHIIDSDRRYVGPNKRPVWEGIYAELYRYTHGLRITRPIVTYQMGGNTSKKKR